MRQHVHSRVLTQWRTDSNYLDATGSPRLLALAGKVPSFAALVHRAVGPVPVSRVLSVLLKHRLVRRTGDHRLRLVSSAFLIRGAQRAHAHAYTLTTLEGIMDTCCSNLRSGKSTDRTGQLQRVALAERFDLRKLPDYDAFLRKGAADFILKNDAWLKHCEVQRTSSRRARAAYVGVGIFGFRAR